MVIFHSYVSFYQRVPHRFTQTNPMRTPETPTWHRVTMAAPKTAVGNFQLYGQRRRGGDEVQMPKLNPAIHAHDACVCICIYANIYIYIYVCVRVYNIYIYVIYIYICVCVCVIYIYMCVWVCVCERVCACVCVSM